MDAGYTYNFVGSGSTINNRALTADQQRRGDFNLHALKLVLEKPLSDANELQAGFSVDLLYGEDAQDFGQENVGSDSLFLEQAIVQFRVPWGNGLDFSIGKFCALIGYEAVERPANLNITVGNAAAIDPAWHTGLLMVYPFSDLVEMGLGIGNGNGIDNGAGVGVNDQQDEIGLTGYLNFTITDETNVQIGFYYAPSGDTGYAPSAPRAGENEPLVIGNLLANWVPECADGKLLLGFNSSLASFNDFSNPAGAPGPLDDASTFFGTAIYGKYQFTDVFSLAWRGEYVHTDDDQFMGIAGVGNGRHDIWGWTTTAGFDMTEDLTLRLEYRVDWGDDLVATAGPDGTAGANSSGAVHTAALQIVHSF